MKLKSFILFLILNCVLYSQTSIDEIFKNKTEIYFKFRLEKTELINELTRIISIDNVNKDTVYAYANKEEFTQFLKSNIPYIILKHPGDVEIKRMSSNIKEILEWDYYPTYDAYVSMMYQFQTQYPNLCKIIDVGNTVQGRKILFAKISDNVDSVEIEPEVQLSSSMHGDETTGYVLMLRLINYLLTNYGTNQEVTEIVNNTEIYINPLANPDGTYRSGNSTVSGATRYNYNNVDLNRNFPDPAAGPHPDGKAWQPETIAMMNFANQRHFTLSANFHGGAEVVNYPWDTWARTHADDSWFIQLSRAYADTVHRYAPSNYMTYLNNGITNGYAWYRVTGGRQDFMNYFMKSREVTIELSNTKLLSPSLLPAHWDYNYRSLLNFIKWSKYGIIGTIKDINGNPIKAKISLQNIDKDSSEVFSNPISGKFFRLVAPGTYTVIISADSFITKTITNVTVNPRTPTTLDVKLLKNGYSCLNINYNAGWNIVSIPLKSNNMHKNFLFPETISDIYGYNNSYYPTDTLVTSKGYWVKFPNNQTREFCGLIDTTNKISVKTGWNIIGVYDKNINIQNITTTPAGIISSPFYEFNGSYISSETLKPGIGYWVKVSQDGYINLPNNK